MFCTLERDLKTYEYFKRYIGYFESGTSARQLDNQIQAEEIQNHLKNNNFSPNDTNAQLEWIQRNGKAFRNYLNSIKLVYFTCRVNHINPRELDAKRFGDLEELVNKERVCLEDLF